MGYGSNGTSEFYRKINQLNIHAFVNRYQYQYYTSTCTEQNFSLSGCKVRNIGLPSLTLWYFLNN